VKLQITIEPVLTSVIRSRNHRIFKITLVMLLILIT